MKHYNRLQRTNNHPITATIINSIASTLTPIVDTKCGTENAISIK